MDIDQITFQQFLTDLGKYYVGVKYLWLRMLLYGIISIGDLDSSTTGLELFNKLAELGEISKTDVSLLSEVAETTEQTSAKDRIAEYKKTVQCHERSGTRLQPYRKALFKTLINVVSKNLLTVICFYQLSDHNFDNIWDVVFYIEQQELLDDTQEKCTRFAGLLNETARRILLDAVNIQTIRDGLMTSPHAVYTQSGIALQPRPIYLTPIPVRKENIHLKNCKMNRLWVPIGCILLAIFAFDLVMMRRNTLPPIDRQKEEPTTMKENDHKENEHVATPNTEPVKEHFFTGSCAQPTLAIKLDIFNDFNHSSIYGWNHYGSANWMMHNNRYKAGYNLGKRYSGSDNYYIYVETIGKQSTKEGYLNSPNIPVEWDDVCLKFYYYISDGDLRQRINVDYIVNGEPKPGFSSQGVAYKRGQWNYACVPINTVGINNSYFMFGGVASGVGKQIVVIDDISISEGECLCDQYNMSI